MKLLTELNFLRGKEPARPQAHLVSSFPSSPAAGPGGSAHQEPPRPPARPGQPAPLTMPTWPQRPTALAQRCFSPLFVCRLCHYGLCSGASQASQRPCPGGPASRRAPARSPAAGLFQLLPSAFPAPGPAEQCSVSLPPSLGTNAPPLPSSRPLSLSWHILRAPPLSRACSLPPWLAPAWLTPVPPSATLCSLFPAQCLLPLPALGHLFIQRRSIMQG